MLPQELRNAVTSLFLSSAPDASSYKLLGSGGGEQLAAEVSKREVRARVFVHMHSVSSSKASTAELVLNVLRVLSAACVRSKGCASQMASDVGVRPLVAILTRARAQPGAQLWEAAALACGLLGIVVAQNSKSSLLLRLESGVDAVCGLLSPLPHQCPALLSAGCALLKTLCSDNEPNIRLVQRRGLLPILAAAVDAAALGQLQEGSAPALSSDFLSLARLLAVLLTVPSQPPQEGPGSPLSLLSNAAVMMRPPYHAMHSKDLTAVALSILKGAVALSVTAGLPREALAAALCREGVFPLARSSLLFHALPSDLVRLACGAMASVAGALQAPAEGALGRRIGGAEGEGEECSGGGDAARAAAFSRVASAAPVGYSSAGISSGCAGGDFFHPCGHLALLKFTLPQSPPGCSAPYPSDQPPPATLSVWPLPPAYPFWRPTFQKGVVEALPNWAAPFLPRSLPLPVSGEGPPSPAALAAAAAAAGAPLSCPTAPPPQRILFSIARAWLAAPHWFPELQSAAAALPEILVLRRREDDSGGGSGIGSDGAAGTEDCSLNPSGTGDVAPVSYSSTGLAAPPPCATFSVPASVLSKGQLPGASLSALSELVPGLGAVVRGALEAPALPSIPGAAASSLPSLRAALQLDHGGAFHDPLLDTLSLPRVWLSPSGLASVKPLPIPRTAIPVGRHGARTPRAVLVAAPPATAAAGDGGGGVGSSSSGGDASSGCCGVPLQPLKAGFTLVAPAVGEHVVKAQNPRLVEIPEPLLPCIQHLLDAAIASSLLRQAARSCASAEFHARALLPPPLTAGALCDAATSGAPPSAPPRAPPPALHRSLCYYRHATAETGSASAPVTVLYGGGVLGASLAPASLERYAGVPLPPISLGTVTPLAPLPTPTPPLHPANLCALCDATDTPSLSELSMCPPLLLPRPMGLMEDGAVNAKDEGGDSGNEEGEEDEEESLPAAAASAAATTAASAPPPPADALAPAAPLSSNSSTSSLLSMEESTDSISRSLRSESSASLDSFTADLAEGEPAGFPMESAGKDEVKADASGGGSPATSSAPHSATAAAAASCTATPAPDAASLEQQRVTEWEAVTQECQETEAPPPPALTFESRFECGNLCSAVRVAPREYELSLEPDVNSSSNQQWFFFRVQGMAGQILPYSFHLVNMDSAGSVFLAGQRPWVYFEGVEEGAGMTNNPVAPAGLQPPPAVIPGSGWRRAGDTVLYHRNTYRRTKCKFQPPVWLGSSSGSDGSGGNSSCGGGGGGGGGVGLGDGGFAASFSHYSSGKEEQQALYTHSWSISFPPSCHTAWFAYCLPYSYSDLLWDVRRWEARALRVSRGEVVSIGEEEEGEEEEEKKGGERLRYGDPAADASPPIPPTLRALGYTVPVGAHPLGLPSRPLPPPGAPLGCLFTSGILQRTILCRSLAGNPLPLLTLTQFSDGPAAVAARPYIVISARVHPGETNASWTLRSVLDTLTSSSPLGLELRRKAIFKVVPMLNPDGVINGCHRLNLAGLDLNREWSSPSLEKSPTIWHMRALIMTLQRRAASLEAAAKAAPGSAAPSPTEYAGGAPQPGASSGGVEATLSPTPQPVLLYVDFHGHSRRRNTFTFGCHELFDPSGEGTTPGSLPSDFLKLSSHSHRHNIPGRLFPKLLAARCETFVFSSCDWAVTRDKLSTARVAMWRDALLPGALTLEMGFSGPTSGTRAGIHNSAAAFADVGVGFCLALMDFLQGPEGLRVSAAVGALKSAGLGERVKPKRVGKGKGAGGKGGNGAGRRKEATILIFSGPPKKDKAPL